MSEAELRRRLDSVTEELLATYEEIEVLTLVADIASSSSDVGVVGRRILEEAGALLQADVAFLIYTDADLKGEEPPPMGASPQERDALATALSSWLQGQPRPIVMAPFHEAAGIPHAPDALLAVPLKSQEQVLGAICLGRRGEGRTFSAGDLKILSVLGSSAAAVLLQRKNLDLVRMARGLEERNLLLKGILEVSREMAASLDLDRLLHAMANLPTRALGFDRCAVSLVEGTRRRLRAVSGAGRVDRGDPELRSLESLLDWVAGRGARVIVRRGGRDGEADLSANPPDAAGPAAAHIKASGARSLLAIPLADDQGMLGVISFESSDDDILDDVRLEGASILANQATVALRNARLYGEVPLIGLLQPIRAGLSRARVIPRRRLTALALASAATAAILVLGRWDLRVPARATVLPHRIVQVSAQVRGVIREVGDYREGDRVPKGAVLARLDAPELELRHNEALSRERTAERTTGKLEAEGRAAELQLARVEEERWRQEREHLDERLMEASLRAPIEGTLLTPRLRERTGELLEVGDLLCTIAQMEPLRVELAVAENDADVLLGAHRSREEDGPPIAVLKFPAFPEVDYTAQIDHVRSSAELHEGRRWLVAEATVSEPAAALGVLRPGMTAGARVSAGSRPLIWLILRRPYRAIRSMIWL